MGKVGETIFSLFFNSNHETNSSGNRDVRKNPGFSGAYPANSFFQPGRYRQNQFFAAGDRTFGTGGAREVTARSTPEELVRDPRVREHRPMSCCLRAETRTEGHDDVVPAAGGGQRPRPGDRCGLNAVREPNRRARPRDVFPAVLPPRIAAARR